MPRAALFVVLAFAPGCYLVHRAEPFAVEDAGTPEEDADVRPPGNAAMVAAGYVHACSVDRAGGVRCWGDGTTFALGPASHDRTPTPVAVDLGGRGVTALAAGGGVTGGGLNCAVTSSSEGLCWGSSFRRGIVVAEAGPFVTAAVGPAYPCLVQSTGPVVCRDGDSSDRFADTMPTLVRVREPVQALDAGEHFFCALAGSQVLCFGSNAEGQLGRPTEGTTDELAAPVEDLPPVVDVTCGREHACALTADGDVYCWGSNVRSQLGAAGAGAPRPRRVEGLPADVVDVEAGHNDTCGLRAGGELVCWGDNDFGQLGPTDRREALGPTRIELPARAVGVSVGGSFICAIDDAADVWCWGRNDYGQLGDGMVGGSRATPARVRF